ncbi:uncharacterized protein VTP21DRAFT_1907 [Calcarisporiella thermophila]|uniref:uncharacterized protein n=1 Tax=Calcarisporiella thermophila TaxID=911321 RepID=UPI003742B554
MANAPKVWPARERIPDIQPGDIVTHCDVQFQWTSQHLKPVDLEPLQYRGDDLADATVRELGVKLGEDALRRMEDWLEAKRGTKDSPTYKLHRELITIPSWVDWDQIERGQRVFWQYSAPMLMGLLHFSLAGGFASPQVTQILAQTGYLSHPRTVYRRLIETAKFVLDCMETEGMKPVSGIGWRSTVRVRLLHAQVRVRLLKNAESNINVTPEIIPINQEENVATLLAFSSGLLQGLRGMGIELSPQDKCDFIAVWRYVGYLVGVDPELDPLYSPTTADIWLHSIAVHMMDPSPLGIKFAHGILEAAAGKPPFYFSVAFHKAQARRMLGNSLSDALDLPQTSRFHRLFLSAFFVYIRLVAKCSSLSLIRTLQFRWLRWYFHRVFSRELHRGSKGHFDFRLQIAPGEVIKGELLLPKHSTSLLQYGRRRLVLTLLLSLFTLFSMRSVRNVFDLTALYIRF